MIAALCFLSLIVLIYAISPLAEAVGALARRVRR